MAETEHRRRRPAVSCSLCRRRKIRCDRGNPCNNCVRSRNQTCVYERLPSQPPRQRLGTHDLALTPREPYPSTPPTQTPSKGQGLKVPDHTSTSFSITARQPSAQVLAVESMKNRIRQLEEDLSKATQRSSRSHESTSDPDREPPTQASSVVQTRDGRDSVAFFGEFQLLSRSVMHKNRLFGQSHFINGVTLFREMMEMLEPHLRDKTSKAVSGVQKCKSLARAIKSCQAPPWPSAPTSMANLPHKDVARYLVDCYLRTSESVYRVLHIPTFKRDFEAIWEAEPEPDMAFLIQLKLVLAIGAATYDEQFTLRVPAIRWVYEAQTWVSQPEFKSRLGLQFLQINILLLLAQEIVAVNESMIWISAGALLRTAVYMGLHRDPAHLSKRTTFAEEMHRRLWNTILEITLQSSITSGGPPLVSLDDFDTEPPDNFDDDQLMTENALPKSEIHFTQVSIAIALRKTFPARLAIAKFLNDLGSQATYPEVLRLDGELSMSYKVICRTLHECMSSTGHSASRFQRSAVDLLIGRYRSSLHMSFLSLALHEAAYAFSRKVLVETSLKICRAAYGSPSSSIVSTPLRSECGNASSGQDDFARLTVCGSGLIRTVPFQASYVIAVELKTQLQEEEGASLDQVHVPLRPDLLAVLEEAKASSLLSIEAGETNMKGHLMICLLSAQIQGLIRGLQKDRLIETMLKAIEEAGEACLPIFEAKAAQARAQIEDPIYGPNRTSFDTPAPSNQMDDWGYMMSDAQFTLSDMEPMNWLFTDETGIAQPLW